MENGDIMPDINTQKCKNNLSMLLSENSYCLIQFWKYEECEQSIKEAVSLLGLDLALAGKFGRRTKWQQFDICQLVLDVKTKSVDIKKLRNFDIKEKKNIEDNDLYIM